MKVSIHVEDKMIINIYAHNIEAPSIHRATVNNHKRENQQ